MAVGAGSNSVRDLTPANATFLAFQRPISMNDVTIVLRYLPISTPKPRRPAMRTCEELMRFIASCPRTYNCRLYNDSSISSFLRFEVTTVVLSRSIWSAVRSWRRRLLNSKIPRNCHFEIRNRGTHRHDFLIRTQMLLRGLSLPQLGHLRNVCVGANCG